MEEQRSTWWEFQVELRAGLCCGNLMAELMTHVGVAAFCQTEWQIPNSCPACSGLKRSRRAGHVTLPQVQTKMAVQGDAKRRVSGTVCSGSDLHAWMLAGASSAPS